MKKYHSVYYAIYENLKNIGNFKQYLIDNFETVVCFHFPHGYSNTPSYFEIYKNGNINETTRFKKYPGESNIIKTLLYYGYFQYILYRHVPRGSYVVVDNPVLCIFSRIASVIKNAKFIYWIGDYYPNNSGFMKIYNLLAGYYNKSLKIVWYVSPPIERIYGRRVNTSRSSKIRRLISLGIKSKNINSDSAMHRPVRLGFIGVIREQQGLDLVFKFLSEQDNTVFEIVGSGYKLKHYQNLARKMKLGKKVKFYGYVEKIDKIAERWDLGIALYENSSGNVSVYCEPTKIKNYLEFQLPVITTRATYFYRELEDARAGVVIDETTTDLADSIDKITMNYRLYKNGVSALIKKYEYKKYYDSKLKFMQKNS